MKSAFKYIFAVIVGFSFCLNIKADLNDYSGGSSGAIGSLSGGSWKDFCVGIKVSIISTNNNVKDVELFLNDSEKCNSSFSYDNNPKNHQSTNITWISSDNVTTYTTSFLPSNWISSKKIINIYNILEKENYKNLKAIINHNSLKSNVGPGDYIVIEPMTAIGSYYGTAFELANAFNLTSNCSKSSSFCWKYQGAVFSGNNGTYSGNNGAMFYRTIYLESDVEALNLEKYSSANYKERNSCFMSKTCGRGIGVFEYNKIYPLGNIEIKKYKEGTSDLITSSSATFKIYNSANCRGDVVDTISTSAGVATSKSLASGTYSIYESKSPSGYSAPGNRCVKTSVTVTAGSTNTQNIYNTPTCGARLESFGVNPTIDQLISLYKEYPNFNNLLNFSNPSCTAKTCDSSTDSGEVILTDCLDATGETSSFNETNLSCYDEQISNGLGAMGFCKSTLDLNNNLGTNKFYSKAGQFLIRKLDYNLIQIYNNNLDPVLINSNYVANATVKKECYVYGDGSISGALDLPGIRVYFGDEERELLSDTEVLENSETYVGAFRRYINSLKYNYKLNDIYVEKITGKTYNEKVNNYSEKYEGIVSNFNSDSGSIYFNLVYNGKNANKSNDNLCLYESKKEIVKNDKLDIELRFIDTKIPFNRKTNTNWCDDEDCSKDNNIVKQYIINKNNSYNIQGKSPIYKIILDSDSIKKIREYNKNNKYDYYGVTEDDEGNYVNAFLYDLKNGVLNKYDDGRVESTYGVLNHRLEVIK